MYPVAKRGERKKEEAFFNNKKNGFIQFLCTWFAECLLISIYDEDTL